MQGQPLACLKALLISLESLNLRSTGLSPNSDGLLKLEGIGIPPNKPDS